MIQRVLLILLILSASFWSRATHVIGGELTWKCQGGEYVFELVVYRDCNGAVISNSSVTVEVWGHPTLANLSLAYVSSTDVSPSCSPVTGGPTPLLCGSGANSGNGPGAIEKAIYRSQPTTILGTPPAEGWIFTYQNFARSGAITNLTSPSTKGITIVAKMFAIPNSVGTCVDNSPQFLQEPYFVSCVGTPYQYNMNAVDVDLDSLHIFFGEPLDHFPGLTYVDGISPVPLVFEPGFNFNSPTPSPAISPGSISSTINPVSGDINFLSNSSGNYSIKITAQSFRNNVLIAEVSREIYLIVTNCSGTNTPPVIMGPFGGLFETTIDAGQLVNFNLASTDVELLQDGSPQSNILSATGLMFGTNYTSNLGCAIAPCATLDQTPLITMPQGVNTTFNWQTDCDHLVTSTGFVASSIPYHFVFKIQDDYCQVPKVSYATITINVRNPGVIDAPEIDCIQTDAAGNVILNWTPVNDPTGTFSSYQIYSVQNGLLGTINTIGTATFSSPAVTSTNDYFIQVASGCNGNTLRSSDTLKNIFLDVTNPGNGTANLQWNSPGNFSISNQAYYHILREYPLGTWSLYDSVPFGTHFYKDTIRICDVFLNYQIVLPNQPCDFTSNIDGDQFQDLIAPNIPIIDNVTIDTLTNEVTITWNQNQQPDTYGYIIYIQTANGSVVELDQHLGISDTTYTYSPDVTLGPLTYSVAAFDSCFTNSNPPTYHTSAKGELHTTNYLNVQLNVCEKTATLTWTGYEGWNNIDRYEILAKTTNTAWTSYGNTTNNSFTIDVIDGETYTFSVLSFSDNGQKSFSNIRTLFISSPKPPAFHYLQVATVNGEQVDLRHYIDASANVSLLSIQKKINGAFTEIDQIPITGNTINYTDSDVEVNDNSYTYRIQYIDSCGRLGAISNSAQTILLKAENDGLLKFNYVTWSPYLDFDGAINSYVVYRGVDGFFGGSQFDSYPNGTYSLTDDVNLLSTNGQICYYVEAVESMNVYGFSEVSRSNLQCITLDPIIYIPNSFTPGGVNPVFTPVISDFNHEQYDFTIFDRWGKVIFKTNDYSKGWDGNIALSGQLAEPGTYIYMVVVHDGSGKEYIQRGHVNLLK